MKKTTTVAMALVLAASIAGCSAGSASGGGASTDNTSSTTTSSSQQTSETDQKAEPVTIKQSPDKYTWYIKNYVGMNASGIGYTALNGYRMESYGAGYIKIVFVTSDGTHIDFSENNDQLKQYKVSAQSYEPNTEIKYTFQVDSEGKEYENLVDYQNIEEIVLSLDKVGESGNVKDNTLIDPAPDKYTAYVRDYVDRNLADCGYVSLSGKYMDSYSAGYVTLNIITEDGSAVDLEDASSLAGWVVTQQDIQPNTAISFTYSTDSDGNEYSNLISSQSLETISLYVSPVSAS